MGDSGEDGAGFVEGGEVGAGVEGEEAGGKGGKVGEEAGFDGSGVDLLQLAGVLAELEEGSEVGTFYG